MRRTTLAIILALAAAEVPAAARAAPVVLAPVVLARAAPAVACPATEPEQPQASERPTR